VTLVAVGTCTIQATQSGSVNYSAATAVNQSFQVTPASSSAPVISSVSPASAPRGGSAFMLTVNGAGFLDGAEVMWDGTTLWTTFVSGTTLSAWVSDSQITSVGTATVAVVNPGGTATAGVSFTIWPGLGTNTLLVGSAAATSSVVLPYSGAWTAAANDSFLHIAAGSASGTGSALIVFSYDAFTSTGSRTGTLTIAGLTVTVTQAGTSYIGPFGPGPLITLASSGLNGPYGVAVDGSGNVYVADSQNSVIREWNASTQQMTTLVSSGLNVPSGVAVDNSGNIYIADTVNNAIKKWNASTQQVTTLVSSGLNGPSSVAVDGSGNVYIADTLNGAIKEWSASTQQVTALVSSGLFLPFGVAVDGSGNVYIADTFNNAIREWSVSTQQVTTLVSSGLKSPRGVAVDGSGNIYIADTLHGAIEEWSASTRQITTLASSGLDEPYGVAVDGSGNVYIADTFNNAAKELPYAFVGPASLTEPTSAGTDSLLPVLPSTAPLTGVYAPTSDSGWLTIGTVANGVVSLSFAANMQTSRIAHVALLGQQITVTQNTMAAQTITFGALPSRPLGTAPFAASATASSGLPVTFASLTPFVCTVAGNTVTLVAVGTCTIRATQSGNASYWAAEAVDQSFQVTQTSQTITFGAIANQPLGTAPFAVSATASSSLPVSFASTTLTVCRVAGNTVTLVGVGTCTIQATQAGNTSYSAATAVNQSFQVTQTSQSITFGALADRVFGSALFTVSGTASSGLPVSFASTTLTVCTVAGNTVTLVGVGTCTIQATQPGNSNYAAATAVNRSFTVTQASQTITFGALIDRVFGSALFTVSGTASSGLPVSFASITLTVCRVAGNTVTLVGVGTCTIQATQAGNTTYLPATPVNQSYQVTQASQTITFGVLANQPYGTVPFTVTATASSGLTVSFASQTNSTCTVVGSAVTLFTVSTCTIQATQAGNTNYAAATAVNRSFTVTQASQTVSFGALANRPLGTAPFTVSATASSGLPVSFASATSTVCTVAGNVVTLLSAGICIVQAAQAGNATYSAATAVNQPFQVTQTSQTISFDALANRVLGTAPFTATATASSGLPVSFLSTTLTVCTVAGNTVTLAGVGTCTIRATQGGNTTYPPATPVNQGFQVTQASQTITFGVLASQPCGIAPFTVTATASSGLTVSFGSQTTSVCTVSGSLVILVAVGTCTIQATQAGNATYAAATPVDQSFQVTAELSSAPAISSLSPWSAAPGGAAFTLTVNGTDFVSGATVDWNGTALTTHFASATKLTASVPATLITSAGIATVTVVDPGAVTSGGVGFTIQFGPAATAVSPGAGKGANQTFAFTFSDPVGYQNLGVLDVLINNYLDGIQACYIAVVPSGANGGTVYLVDDGGDAGGPFAGYLALPGTGSVSNSQCTVSGAGSSVVGSGTTLTLTLNISFTSSFAGDRIFYTAARDTGTGNSGWQALSTRQVPGATATPTQATGVTPASGSGASQSFVFTFADSAGWQNLGVVDMLFNNFLDGIQGCYIAYSVPAATLYLVDDAGDAGGPFAGYLALPGTGSVSNSQCTVNGTGSSSAGSGNTLTLTLNVSFTPAFAGNRVFYTAAGNAAGTENSGWQALGAWTVP
jgi:sugar lactone lactonase YvrE